MKISSQKNLFNFAVLTILILFGACSSTSRHKILSIFFDGVRNPENHETAILDSLKSDSTLAASIPRRIQSSQPEYVFHPPYREKSCDDCHDLAGASRLLEPEPQLCYGCHDDFKEQYAFLHGPVASGNCTACHNPHMTKNEKLLKRTGQQLCLYCHEIRDVLKNEEHEDLAETDVCTDCHNPHGGDDRYLF
jgi:predicted CXXCH cytochrome family protein